MSVGKQMRHSAEDVRTDLVDVVQHADITSLGGCHKGRITLDGVSCIICHHRTHGRNHCQERDNQDDWPGGSCESEDVRKCLKQISIPSAGRRFFDRLPSRLKILLRSASEEV